MTDQIFAPMARNDGDMMQKGPTNSRPGKREHLPFRLRVIRVTWQWFPCTMSTGALASLLSQQPFEFPGLTIIGTMVYLVDIALFVLFSCLIGMRFIYKPGAIPRSLHHPSESFFFGSWWVSLALIIYSMAAYGIPGLSPDNEWLISGTRVLFWMYYACATIVAVMQYHIIFHAERLDPGDAMPAWILPAYPFLVTGPLAAQVAKTQTELSATQIIVAGIAGQGLGWMLSLLMYSVYWMRLMKSELPHPDVRPGMFVSVGPAAYTCTGLLALGKQATLKLPEGFMGITSVNIGAVWFAASLPASLFLWMTAIWFSAVSVVTILRDLKRMRFAITWWALVFPNAGLTIATIQIGENVGSTAIQAVASGMTIILVILWMVCAVLHIRAVWVHDILCPGKDPGVDDVNARDDDRRARKLSRLEA